MEKDRPVGLQVEGEEGEATAQARDLAAIVSAPPAAKKCRTSRGYPVLIRSVLNAVLNWSGNRSLNNAIRGIKGEA